MAKRMDANQTINEREQNCTSTFDCRVRSFDITALNFSSTNFKNKYTTFRLTVSFIFFRKVKSKSDKPLTQSSNVVQKISEQVVTHSKNHGSKSNENHQGT